MIDGGSLADPVGKLSEEFMARYRRGERPALAEYTEKYPELADRIRDVFPMLVVMEEADSGSASSGDATGTGPAGAPGASSSAYSRRTRWVARCSAQKDSTGTVPQSSVTTVKPGSHSALRARRKAVTRKIM